MSLVGELILGDDVEAQPMLMRMRLNLRVQMPTRRLARTGRAVWKARIQAVERVTGRRRNERTADYGDLGQNPLLAVSSRHLGWRLPELVREVPGLSDTVAAQGIETLRGSCAENRKPMAVASALPHRWSMK